MEISASKKINGVERKVTVQIPLAENLQDAIAQYGEEVVYSNFLANVKIGAQAPIRKGIEQGKTDEEIQAVMANYKPGVKLMTGFGPGAGALTPDRALKAFENFTKEEQDSFIAMLKKSAAAKKA